MILERPIQSLQSQNANQSRSEGVNESLFNIASSVKFSGEGGLGSVAKNRGVAASANISKFVETNTEVIRTLSTEQKETIRELNKSVLQFKDKDLDSLDDSLEKFARILVKLESTLDKDNKGHNDLLKRLNDTVKELHKPKTFADRVNKLNDSFSLKGMMSPDALFQKGSMLHNLTSNPGDRLDKAKAKATTDLTGEALIVGMLAKLDKDLNKIDEDLTKPKSKSTAAKVKEDKGGLLTKEELAQLKDMGYEPRGTGFAKDNKFVKTKEVDSAIAKIRGTPKDLLFNDNVPRDQQQKVDSYDMKVADNATFKAKSIIFDAETVEGLGSAEGGGGDSLIGDVLDAATGNGKGKGGKGKGKVGKVGKLGGLVKGAGILAAGATVLDSAMGAYSDWTDVEEKQKSGLLTKDQADVKKGEAAGKGVGGAAGGIGGAMAGAAAGAALGSVVPVVGTAIGGIVGGTLGAFGGGWLGEKAGSWLGGKSVEGYKKMNVQPTEDLTDPEAALFNGAVAAPATRSMARTSNIADQSLKNSLAGKGGTPTVINNNTVNNVTKGEGSVPSIILNPRPNENTWERFQSKRFGG